MCGRLDEGTYDVAAAGLCRRFVESFERTNLHFAVKQKTSIKEVVGEIAEAKRRRGGEVGTRAEAGGVDAGGSGMEVERGRGWRERHGTGGCCVEARGKVHRLGCARGRRRQSNGAVLHAA